MNLDGKEDSPSQERNESEKLEDILNSIRNMIDNQEYKNFSEEDQESGILELTKVAPSEAINGSTKSGLVSDNVVTKSSDIINEFASKVQNYSFDYEEKPIDNMIKKLVEPLLKDWLDSNLPKIVEKIVSEEIKRIMPKK